MRDMLAGLAQDRQQEDQAIQELSTGRKVNQPSDNPAAVAGLIVNNAKASAVNTYLSNDSTLNSVVTTLSQAISLAVEGANSTMNQTDRNALAQEVSGIQQQILGYAN